MESPNLFYTTYDTLYQGKNYKKEIDAALRLAKKYGVSSPKRALEIGCGTGNHTKELARRVSHLVATDIDPRMIAIAKKKLADAYPHVHLTATPIERLREKNFDFAIALFNVVTYIPDAKQLTAFINGVARHLAPGGIFIFDCWNGIAATLNPPRAKTTSAQQGGEKITCALTPKTDLLNQKVVLTYRLAVTNGKKVRNGTFSFSQTLWTPMQIRNALQNAGLMVLSCAPLSNPNHTARATDWKILFCARKPRHKSERSKN